MKFIDVTDHPGWQYISGHPKTRIYKTSTIGKYAKVSENAKVYGKAEVYGNAKVSEWSRISGKAEVYEYAKIWENAQVYGNAKVYGNAEIYGLSCIAGNAEVYGNARIRGNGEILKTEDYLEIQSPDVYAKYITLHRDTKIGIRINCGGCSETLEEYIYEHRELDHQYFHQGMMTKYYNMLKNRMTPL